MLGNIFPIVLLIIGIRCLLIALTAALLTRSRDIFRLNWNRKL